MSRNREHSGRRLLIVSAVLLVLIALAVWQWDNIGAVYLSLRYDDEQLEDRLEQYEEELTGKFDALKEELNAEAEPALETPNVSGGRVSAGRSTTPRDNSAKLARVDEIISEIYALRDSYTAQIDELQLQAFYEFDSLPDDEKTPEAKKKIAFAYIDEGTALEKQCDAQIENRLSELDSVLNDLGKDTDVVNDAAYVYAQEKQIKKAQLMSKLGK